MSTLSQMHAQGYRPGAPSYEAEEIDAQVAGRWPCPRCGGPMRYEGFHRTYNGYTEYVAMAVCNRCGRRISF